MMYQYLATCVCLALALSSPGLFAASATAAPKMSMIPSSAALEPAAARQAFELAEGIEIELVASEPMVISPVAMAFDDRGRLFVVEMPGFPLGNRPGQKPVDRVVMLEDTNRDGRMDKRTVYADGLAFPMGVLPWQDGVIVTCAPDILFLRDTDNDGRADQRRVLFTGFSVENTQALRINCPTLGPDGWIYIASGLSGGTIATPEHPERPALKMAADVRFDPETLVIENVVGRTQYGMSFDEAGRRFLCYNRMPVQHVVLAAKWLQRNPNLTFTETVQDCSERTMRNIFRAGSGDGVKLFPISHNFVNVDSHAGSVTAACAVTIWRGGALPRAYQGAAFSCEPTANLVHVDRLLPTGATFAAEPMFEQREFLASRDDWFRPVFLTAGPDGALYIADMYRKIIEHIDYLPEEIRKYADVNAGRDRGRIWRVFARQELRSPLPPRVLPDESWINIPQPTAAEGARQWMEKRIEAAGSSDGRTRFLAALALGSCMQPRATRALASVGLRDMGDRWARAAVLSGAAGRERQLLEEMLPKLDPLVDGATEFVAVLGRGFPDVETIHQALRSRGAGNEAPPLRLAIVTALLVGFAEKNNLRLEAKSSDAWLGSVLREVVRLAADQNQQKNWRLSLLRLLGRMTWNDAGPVLLKLSASEPDESVRDAAIRSLAAFEVPAVADALLAPESWSAATPRRRDAILNALLAREFHRRQLLQILEAGRIPAGAVTGIARRKLLGDKDPAIRQRAEKLWGGRLGTGKTVFEAAQSALALQPDPIHGRTIFKQYCSSCHRLDREGYNVGPDLADMRRQAKQTILYHIVVPDAEIAPMYAMYVADTKDGRTLGGLLTGETATSITLLGPLALEEKIPRNEIVRLEAQPGSMMPSGFDAAMSRQDLADLLGYLRGEGGEGSVQRMEKP